MIKTYGLNKERGKRVEKIAIALTIKNKKMIKESEIISFLIDEMIEKVDKDDLGFFIKEKKEVK